MRRYAQDTGVSAYRSQEEISRVLQRYGATEYTFGLKPSAAAIQFRLERRVIRMILPFPSPDSEEFLTSPTGRRGRSEEQARRAHEQACRQCWRALALVVKAKLEAVAAGITTVDKEFMAHILLPDGSTVGQFMAPQIETAYRKGAMPQLIEFAPN